MVVDTARAKSLFLAASDLANPAERAAYLDRECGGEAELRARVEALLRANDAAPLAPPREAAGDYTPEPSPLPTTDYQATAEAGTVIAGRYTLLEKIGEGGMGSVWRAKQTEPVKRFVAVKLIKAGMDSRQVLARFEAERQALALMDHPNIAKVLDGGLIPLQIADLRLQIDKTCMEQASASNLQSAICNLQSAIAWAALLRHGAGQGRADHRLLRPVQVDAAGAAAAVRPGVPGDPARPPQGHHSPRHQAVERADRNVRRQAGGQGDRLRRGQGDGRGADRAQHRHRVRRRGGDSAVHVAGAGHVQ